ncbi:MAG: Gfo/Idh/MocA family oxidoreductase [Saprospiraceae bacterium]|nr:Gfo/Idh/MocA family oxidoreductase [Saprospiraceae bacterium]
MITPRKYWYAFSAFSFVMLALSANGFSQEPVKIGIAGLVHTHVHWLLGREANTDIEIVGIAEPNKELAERFLAEHGLSMDLWYPSIEQMLKKAKPEAVCTFTTTADHLRVVELCAPKGIHVMVEKPLALNYEIAKQMADLAEQYNIQLLTNYESTWYGSTQQAYRIVNVKHQIGDLTKMEAHHGHPGPVAIGVNEEFLEWLTDPALNGGGALPDFGCYGANLFTYFTDGQRPESVSCFTRQFQPELYPDVEDEALLILNYSDKQGIIQASWNWADNRKMLYLNGTEGYVHCLDGANMRMYTQKHPTDAKIPAPKVKAPRNDPFGYLAYVVRGLIKPEPWECSALPNNLLVMEILDAARKSAETGLPVSLNK